MQEQMGLMREITGNHAGFPPSSVFPLTLVGAKGPILPATGTHPARD